VSRPLAAHLPGLLRELGKLGGLSGKDKENKLQEEEDEEDEEEFEVKSRDEVCRLDRTADA